MAWHGIEGHDDIVEQFRRAVARGRLASSFLFVGPPGVGKRTFAWKLAQALLCRTNPEERFDPCECCPSCVQTAAMTHPDVQMIGKPDDRAFIPLELILGDKEHRRQEGLCRHIALKPFLSSRKVAIIDDADYLNAEGANALLKTLEEPPPQSILILVGTSPAKQLPTIRSRCQLIRFNPLPVDVVARLLVEKGIAADREQAERASARSQGSLKIAEQFLDAAIWEFRESFLRQLSVERCDCVSLAKSITAFVEEAGKEAAARRMRLHQAIAMAAEHFRLQIRAGVGGESGSRVLDPEKLAARLERCLNADADVDRNVNQAMLIESWADALAST